jgi:hypothetical protein
MKSLGKLCSGPKYGSSSRLRAPKNNISLPPSIGAAIDAYGPGVLDEVKKIGLTFDAGVEAGA